MTINFESRLSPRELCAYVERLLDLHLPDRLPRKHLTTEDVNSAFDRLEYSFMRVRLKYYHTAARAVFDHLHADHMATFLWFLSNDLWRRYGDEDLPTRLSYLNKAMHGIDIFFSVPMPNVFLLSHPVGAVIGRGTFDDYLVVYQQVTVGATKNGFPSLGRGVVMYVGSAVLGNCTVGNDVVFGAHSMLIDTDAPSGHLVVGRYPHHRFILNQLPAHQRAFGHGPCGEHI